MNLELLIRDLVGIEGLMFVISAGGAVGEVYVDPSRKPEFSGGYATIWGDRWHIHLNLRRVVAVQFVEAEDHGTPYLYYARFSDNAGETVIRAYFPNPYLDDDEKPTEFQPQKLRVFEEMRDRYVGQEGFSYVQRRRQEG